ncbi:Maf family protein [Rhodospirillum rubrum]|uniref:Nucleoside triphosphate pyrophosphatase n=1 Tax=Rhodospirillum rubrum (strain ATCC 11170 / ATH 1.1.1 / DSM 467 / LMG 4362 / NCIMB 8255 / S1) TaxID=269796 RepID=NTPP_RHORT|nr:nucleoside triphosphate pyrophosphatase [Rhodospirillum rubrum]Q2RN87.1 RecName: Full=Nucleoside triphosphate pyrophosphatase; AltName: Full=Nucleotide pyrophosphatase; Short=Nucleotide PPase [Rhodospirillum rubrum ATCC 11170]ABC24408.1 Maf-like protein [Rhodospirillum rubrum ATCC 11170]AEO50159.1 Maf-like protein [Rhodospirillum rubrum F11]MBK5956128.1 maf-like protein [Rhodospirillum rubrum]QXG80331.1 Maf family protein [Rhodospirillum rubrum]HAQ00078.1 maf-like protein [Rhodospirillum r
MSALVPPVLLASSSPSRGRLLSEAGVPFTAAAPGVDEQAIKASLKAEGVSARDAAIHLGEWKARRLSLAHPQALVIGGDQIAAIDDLWLDKPGSLATARQHLLLLRGRTHVLETAVVVLRDGQRLWHHLARPKMTMRSFSDAFLEDYLDRAGAGITACAGAYQIEGLGLQLFAAIEGDLFSIQGLPLLPLLDFLRPHGVLLS